MEVFLISHRPSFSHSKYTLCRKHLVVYKEDSRWGWSCRWQIVGVLLRYWSGGTVLCCTISKKQIFISVFVWRFPQILSSYSIKRALLTLSEYSGAWCHRTPSKRPRGTVYHMQIFQTVHLLHDKQKFLIIYKFVFWLVSTEQQCLFP